MLNKQSIRKNVTIYLNGKVASKDEIIELSKEFTEVEEQRFRKMIKQGGRFKVKNNRYDIRRIEKFGKY